MNAVDRIASQRKHYVLRPFIKDPEQKCTILLYGDFTEALSPFFFLSESEALWGSVQGRHADPAAPHSRI
jgi:hypothetical protein